VSAGAAMGVDVPRGTLATALAHGRRLLATAPALAEQQAEAILEAVPGSADAILLMGQARLRQDDAAGAKAILAGLAANCPDWAEASFALALALTAAGESGAAIAALRRAGELDPGLAAAWRALADQLTLTGDAAGADEAHARAIRASVNDPELMQAAQALCDDQLPVVERILRARLKRTPTDVAAIRMLAEKGARLGRYADAEALLERCLELAPAFLEARHHYAIVLNRQNKALELKREADRLLEAEPGNPAFRALKATALARIGEFEAAIALYTEVLKAHPGHAKVRLSLGHALKSAGRTKESVAAYEQVLDLAPSFGEAWWSLANLKTYRFSQDRVAAMRAQLDRSDLGAEDRLHLEFALGKALEDARAYEASFRHYERGNRLRRAQVGYDAGDLTGLVARSRELLTPEFFAGRAGQGGEAATPIFVVGLPRSGSTLVEQILASHSAVEGTQELPEITVIARTLGRARRGDEAAAYPGVLAQLDAEQARALGESYLERTRIYRKSSRPFFIDKMPNNFVHVGLIHLILPNAKIVDVRRHPMAAGFSAYKQHFAAGQHFTYDLEELGLYYRDYVELMAHFDEALPGRVHRVVYERLVEDTEGEVRRLLDGCGLPYEAGCLRFHENDRAVRTASSEQVRRPIFKDAVEHWRAYEPWLGPLKAALGAVLHTYPEAPAPGS
jgi:tetratricopeptide (TPR) repeat protein